MLSVERGQLARDAEARPGITVDALLSHASGLPAWKHLGPGPRGDVVMRVAAEPLEAAPGTRAVYSDLGFILLGDLIERTMGARLDVLFAREIAAPLGVALRFLPEDHARCAPCEGRRGIVHDDNALDMDGVAGHAGLFGSARDVARLAQSLLASWLDRDAVVPRLVAPETIRAFLTPSPVPGSTWRYGWDGPSARGSQAGERWPKDGSGHLGFTGCSLWLDPPRGRAVVLLSNRVEPTRANEAIKTFRPELQDAVVAALDDD
jgi:CubicO group peptidase (beta-lactamase class C family)